MWYNFAFVACLIPATLAIFPDEAYKVDYQHALLGLPQHQTTFFHQPQVGSKASLIYTLSEKSLLGAVNPKDGSLVWRQQLPNASNSSDSFLRAGENQDVVISGLDQQVAAWSAADGKLVWSNEYETPGAVKDLEILEIPEGASGAASKDVIVLIQGESRIVQRLNWKTGSIKWQYTDGSSDTPFQVLASATEVYYLSFIGSKVFSGLRIRVTVLDPLTGQKTRHYVLSSESDVLAAADVIYVGSNNASPIVAWSNKARDSLKINIIGTTTVSSFPVSNKNGEAVESIAIHAPHRITALSHFLVHYQTAEAHWAEVYHIDIPKSKISKAYDIPRLAGKGAFAASTSDANVYFTRIAKGAFIVLSSTSHAVADRYLLKDFGVPGLLDYPSPVLAIAEVNRRSDSRISVRAAVLLSSGDWVLILNGQGSWTRHEGLSAIQSAVFAEIPQKQALAQQLAIEEHASPIQAYIHRVNRHLRSLQHLPLYLQSLPAKITWSVLGKEAPTDSTSDNFGFHKHVIVMTESGRLMALDTANGGNVVWSVQVPGYQAGVDWVPPTLHASPNGIIRLKGKTEHSVFETLTGKFLRKGTESSSKVKPGTGTIVKYAITDGQLVGFVGEPITVPPLWTFKPKGGERILNVTSRLAVDPVASIGDVLGDRRVLYKYLNPNLALVTTVSDKAGSASFYLLDSVSGNVLYHTTHTNVDTSRPVTSVVSENWLAYSFTVDSTPDIPSRGFQLVIAKLFESPLPNDRGPLGPARNYSTLNPSSSGALTPHVLTHTYHIPEEISHLSVSQTRQGITSRLLLAVLPQSGAIVGIPLNALDPRRPVGRDPTKTEMEEGLVRYLPNLDFDPKWYLTHKREVLGIRNILTSPAVLESTSLVFAYGHDVFGTRVSPSFTFDVLGKDFNKVQMLLTVVALGLGVLVIAPLVRRKQNNLRWEIT